MTHFSTISFCDIANFVTILMMALNWSSFVFLAVITDATFITTMQYDKWFNSPRPTQNDQRNGVVSQNNSPTETCLPWEDNIELPKTSCNFTISNASRMNFMNSVATGFEFIHLRLIFPEKEEISSTKCVIEPKHWVWTTAGQNGGKLYLALPVGFDIWSMTTLNASVFGPIDINLTSHQDCPLIIGNKQSTAQLATAFMQLGDAISGYHTKEHFYLQRGFFCYMERMFISNHALYKLCLHVICPLVAMRYRCFQYTAGSEKGAMKYEHSYQSFHFWWWQFPFLVGTILSAFVPLQLMHFAQICHDGIYKLKHKNYSRIQDNLSTDNFDVEIFPLVGSENRQSFTPSTDDVSYHGTDTNMKTFIWETDERPVTLMSILCLQIMRCFSFRCTVVSRVVRAMFPICSMALVVLNTLLVGLYHHEFVVHAVEKGLPLGFRSVLAGVYPSSTNFLPFLGGPYVACTFYIIIGALLISVPNDFSKSLARALYDNNNVVTSLLRLDEASIEKHGFVRIVDKHGYRKVQSQMTGQCFMLLNPAFWKYITQILIQRWSNFLGCEHKIGRVATTIVRLFAFIPYIAYCLCEIATALLFYGIPIINFTYTFMRANYKQIVGIHEKKMIFYFVRVLTGCVVSLLALFVIFMFYIIFLDSFLFLARVVIYTYTGMFARPDECYGYIVVGIWVLYYLWQSVNQIGNVYEKLLKDTILVSQRLQSKINDGQRKYIFHMNNTPGIPDKLFEYVIERHKPRMKEVFESAVKVFFIILMIVFSVRILMSFEKVESFYLLIHIFQAIFICMVPKLATSIYGRADRRVEEKYFRQELRQTVIEFWREQECVQSILNVAIS